MKKEVGDYCIVDSWKTIGFKGFAIISPLCEKSSPVSFPYIISTFLLNREVQNVDRRFVFTRFGSLRSSDPLHDHPSKGSPSRTLRIIDFLLFSQGFGLIWEYLTWETRGRWEPMIPFSFARFQVQIIRRLCWEPSFFWCFASIHKSWILGTTIPCMRWCVHFVWCHIIVCWFRKMWWISKQ